jgi:hypothetical protein
MRSAEGIIQSKNQWFFIKKSHDTCQVSQGKKMTQEI